MDLETFKNKIKDQNFFVLDTETTGVDDNAELCQIAVIDSKGNTLLNCLVKPSIQIPEEASRIHGITNEQVANAYTFDRIIPYLKFLFKDRLVLIYNEPYDVRVLNASARAVGQEVDWGCEFLDVMKPYAEFNGEPNPYPKYGLWRNVKLIVAAEKSNVVVENAHDALGDCFMTLGVVRYLERQ